MFVFTGARYNGAHTGENEPGKRLDLKGNDDEVLPETSQRRLYKKKASRKSVASSLVVTKNGQKPAVTAWERVLASLHPETSAFVKRHLHLVTNSPMALIMVEVMNMLGMTNLGVEIAMWLSHIFNGLANLWEACDRNELKLEWEHDQITVWLDLMHDKFYSGSTLDSQWSGLKRVGKLIGKKTTKIQELHFLYIRVHAKEIKDNKFPITLNLLNLLVEVTNKVLRGYNATLAKALFLCAWAFSMRICEYTDTESKAKKIIPSSHNLRARAIRTSEEALSCTFKSDKTSKFERALKHRSVNWKLLPGYAREVVEKYMKIRPPAKNFFCLRDGRALVRNDFLNLLDVCLLQTGWATIHTTPHCFRQGRCSQQNVENVDIAMLKFDGRWSLKNDTVVDSYVRSDIATLVPEKILEDFPKARPKWTDKRLIYIAENMVETAGTGKGHAFYQALKKRLPEQFTRIEKDLPAQYPHEVAISRITSEYEALESEIFLNAQAKARLVEAVEFRRRSMISTAVKKIFTHKKVPVEKRCGFARPPTYKAKEVFLHRGARNSNQPTQYTENNTYTEAHGCSDRRSYFLQCNSKSDVQ